jgi:two-component system cell cycle sensor histidine kinase/response regulator CckA
MTTRFSDDGPSKEVQDFIARKHGPSMSQVALLFGGALTVAASITASVNNKPALIAILFILLAAVGWYVVVQTHRTRDLLMTTEFQNALFSSALGLNNEFCLILRRDGAMVYFDRGFQDMFSDFLRQSQRNFAFLLQFGNVAAKDRDTLLTAVNRGSVDKVVFSIETRGRMQKLVVHIDPIQRPSGFVLLRGREFIEQRAAVPVPPPKAPEPKRPW